MNAYKLSEHDSQNHVINTLFDRESFFDSIYKLFVAELEILKIYIDEYMKKKFITKFVSFTNTFIFLVKKSNNKLRLCVNYVAIKQYKNMIATKSRDVTKMTKMIVSQND